MNIKADLVIYSWLESLNGSFSLKGTLGSEYLGRLFSNTLCTVLVISAGYQMECISILRLSIFANYGIPRVHLRSTYTYFSSI